ncbi:hypothetical protein [Rhodopila sp.]|uniref:hypothetical protein n=1 Tax=Rhodopila sp. TaxID=2480087 RepID=UPI003D12D3AC
MALGVQLERAVAIFEDVEDVPPRPFGRLMGQQETDDLRDTLRRALAECKALRLPVSSELLNWRVEALPSTAGELSTLIETIHAELRTLFFVFMPTEAVGYYRLELAPSVQAAFPRVARELSQAGESYAFGLYTACVFHSMRAAEIGVRTLGGALSVSFPDKPIDLAEWHQILDQCEARIKAIGQQPKSSQRDADQQPMLAKAMMKEAARVLDHVRDFFEGLASRLSESGAG